MATPRLRRLTTPELEGADIRAIRALLEEAFGDDPEERFGEDDWQHALGGTHVVLDIGGELAGHAAVVERRLVVGERALRVGYVEAVAIARARQGEGLGTRLMEDVDSLIRERFELGALGTGSHHFYERLGWRTWQGPSFVQLPSGERRTTSGEDGFILVLATPGSPALTLADPICCEWRPGDVW